MPHRVGKVVPPKSEILKEFLFLFPGAKIGVLGLKRFW